MHYFSYFCSKNRLWVTSTHNLYFELKYEKYQIFLSENFMFLEVKFSIYLNRHVFVMNCVFLRWAQCNVEHYQTSAQCMFAICVKYSASDTEGFVQIVWMHR